MKVIFLDHDGVICLSNNWGSRMNKQRKFGRSLGTSMRDFEIHTKENVKDHGFIKFCLGNPEK